MNAELSTEAQNHEPLVPLKFQLDHTGSSFLIYNSNALIFLEVKQAMAPEFFDIISDATGMTEPLTKKYFLGGLTPDHQLLIDVETGELEVEDF